MVAPPPSGVFQGEEKNAGDRQFVAGSKLTEMSN